MRHQSSVHSRVQVLFGERFTLYAQCVWTLSLEQHRGHFTHHLCFVSLQVLNAWADAAQQLSPLLHVVKVGYGYASSVADARAVLRFLTPNIDEFCMICPAGLSLDADETEQLKTSSTGLQNLRFEGSQQAAQLLASTVIGASTRYVMVQLSLPLPSLAITHLGQCPRLHDLDIQLVGPAIRNLPIGAFGALTQLQLHDFTNELPGMHFFLALPSHIRLQSFSYTMGYQAPFLNRSCLHQFVQHITSWFTLTSVVLILNLEDGASYMEAYREIHTRFHALPHLKTLNWGSNIVVALDITLVRDFLSACPHLAEWIIFNVDALEVSLPAFVSLLSTYPNIRYLPVRVCCNEMPSPGAVANCGASRYGGTLAVTDVKDPDAVAGVLRRVVHYVTRCSLDLVWEVQAVRIRELNKLLA
jgi:hypothetical protein